MQPAVDRPGSGTDTHSSFSKTSGGRGFHMNFDLVLQRIRELNIFAGEGESFVQTTATGAQLATKDPIPLRLYRNGIVMFDGPFRSYQEHSTQQCMQDLMDGYFPSELQERFPDGVPFEVNISFFFFFTLHGTFTRCGCLLRRISTLLQQHVRKTQKAFTLSCQCKRKNKNKINNTED
uniref:UBX domain-containing protein 11 n=1 Tax=Amphilophus citrinellus TaxID=61819 RepID=A0A3Q0RVZ4_AMPCI